jgi:predicted N-acetyltransferase YhbS
MNPYFITNSAEIERILTGRGVEKFEKPLEYDGDERSYIERMVKYNTNLCVHERYRKPNMIDAIAAVLYKDNNTSIFIIDENHHIVGIINFEVFEKNETTKVLYITNICSSYNPHIKGIGSTLINYTKSLATELNVDEIQVSSITDANGFYKKQGFQEYNPYHMYFTVSKITTHKTDTKNVEEKDDGKKAVKNQVVLI